MQKSILLILWNLCATVLLFLAIDYGYSNVAARSEFLDNFVVESKFLRRQHPVYHHTLAANARVTESRAGNEHQICTDRHGFKSSCLHEPVSGSQFDLAFIGDSFVEALGVSYEDSFVGMFARAQPQLRVANLGVSSYFPGIYLVKVRHLLNQGVQFDHLVVFIDISDIQDETQYFIDAEGHVRSRPAGDSSLGNKLAAVAVKHWQLSAMLYQLISHGSVRQIDLYKGASWTVTRAEWTYQADSSHYGDMGVAGAIALAVSHMESLHELLRAHDILLSVGVHPWPAQLKHDNLADSRQSRIWRDFCRERCAMYIDSFPAFQQLVNASSSESVSRDFYIFEDIHFNRRGNQLIFDVLNDSWSAFQGNALH